MRRFVVTLAVLAAFVSAAVFAGGAVLSRLFSSTEKEGTLS